MVNYTRCCQWAHDLAGVKPRLEGEVTVFKSGNFSMTVFFVVEIYLIQLSPIPGTRQQWPQFA